MSLYSTYFSRELLSSETYADLRTDDVIWTHSDDVIREVETLMTNPDAVIRLSRFNLAENSWAENETWTWLYFLWGKTASLYNEGIQND